MIKFILQELTNTNNGTRIIESQRLNEKWFYKKGFIKEFNELLKITDGDPKNKELLFLYIVSFQEGRETFPKLNYKNECLICSSKTKFFSIAKGYKKTCSKACEMKLGKETIERLRTDIEGSNEIVNIDKLKIFIKENLINNFGRFEKQRLKDRHFLLRNKLQEYLLYKNFLNDKIKLDPLLEEMTIKITDKSYDERYINQFYKPGGLYDTEVEKKLIEDENGNNHHDRVQIKRRSKDENGLNNYDRLHAQRLKKDENGLNFYDRKFKEKYKDYTKTKEDFALYSWLCRRMTEKQPIHLLTNFDKRGHANKGMYHLDHKYSISEGFRNNVPVHIIGSIHNLEMIIARNNLKKHADCSISLDHLYELVEVV